MFGGRQRLNYSFPPRQPWRQTGVTVATELGRFCKTKTTPGMWRVGGGLAWEEGLPVVVVVSGLVLLLVDTSGTRTRPGDIAGPPQTPQNVTRPC